MEPVVSQKKQVAPAAAALKPAPEKKAVARKTAATPAKPAKAAVQARGSQPAEAAKAVKPVKPAKPLKAAKPVKIEKAEKAVRPEKLVRDSFTIPRAEYTQLQDLKARATAIGRPAKKSEVLRAGIQALKALDDAGLLAVLAQVPVIKTGRPSHD